MRIKHVGKKSFARCSTSRLPEKIDFCEVNDLVPTPGENRSESEQAKALNAPC